jgi:signal transduction histidine kinase
MKWFNSFRFQLYSILAISGIALVAVILIGLNAMQNAANSQRLVQLVGQQRSNALLLSLTAHQINEASEEAQLRSLIRLTQTLILNFDRTELALRQQDAGFNIIPIQNTAALSVLSELDTRWSKYRASLQTFLTDYANLTTSSSEKEAFINLLSRQGLDVFTYSDRLSEALNTLLQQDIEAVQQISLGILALTAVFLITAFVVISNAVRSVNGLARSAEQLAGGNLAARAPVHGANEIARVGQVFNNMAAELEKSLVVLQEQVIESQAARDRAERSDKVKSAFLASMSHELRTPLNAVINFTRFVMDGDTGPVNDQQSELLGEVVNSARHLLNLINDVLDMSKIEAGSLNLFIEDNVSLDGILTSAIATGRGLLKDKDVLLQTEIEEKLPLVRADRQRITQILLNILSNACKFTEQGEIRVKAYTHDDEVVVAVADTGPGIALEDQALVFEPFKQTKTGIRQGGGTGLGMPIAKSLAEAHGGRLWLESESGKGATFYIALPVKAADLTPLLTPQGMKS